MSNEEWVTILKHLKKDEESGFESHRFDLLDERNRKKAEEVRYIKQPNFSINQ